MDMNKILNNFEAASTGNYEPSKSETSDMKMILESFYDVAQADATESQPQQLDEIASVTMSGDSADEVARLAKLMNGSAPEAPQTTAYQGPPDMPPKDTMITPKMMDDFDVEDEPVAEDDWDNAPEETYDDHEKMTLDLSGGINRRKPKGSIRVKDPANFSENSLAEELSSMLKKKMSEKKDQDGDGDNDFDDVKIARMKASGMSHDEAVAKVKGKKESSKKHSDTEVDKVDEGKISDFVRRKNYERLARRSQDKATKAMMKAADFEFSDLDNREEHEDEFMRQMAKRQERARRAKELGSDDFEEAASKKNSNKEVDEAGKMKGGGDDPCWKNYKMVGTKKKGGKEVPNCVPKEGVQEDEQIDEISADLAKRAKSAAKASELDHLMKGHEKIKRTKNIPFVSKMGRKSADRDLEKASRRKRQANLADRKLGGMGDYRYDDEGRYGREGPAKVLAKKDENKVEEAAPKNNPVAKNAGKFNKAQTHKDKKKAQKRGEQKHKGKEMAMESAPVFDRYVKPFLDKTPSQIVEFYDREALNIIDRLSQERRTLAKAGTDTQLHEAIIGKLREGLSALPEDTLTEARGRRYRSSFDIGRTGYGDGRGANLGSDKAAFKRREMEVELGDEEPNNYAVYISGKPWKVFRSQRSAQKAAATIKAKYGKDAKVMATAARPSS